MNDKTGFKVFVTGESGNIAQLLIPLLEHRGVEVVNNWKEFRHLKKDVRAKYEMRDAFFDGTSSNEIDILNADALEEVFRSGINTVFHTAAVVGTDKCHNFRENAVNINLRGTVNVANAVKKHECDFVNFSTTAVFDPDEAQFGFTENCKVNPRTLYGLTKYAAQCAVKSIVPDKRLLNLLPVFFFSNYPQDNSSAITKMLYSHFAEKSIDVQLHGRYFKNYLWAQEGVELIYRLWAYNCIGDVIVANNFKNIMEFDRIYDSLASRIVNPNVFDLVKFHPDNDYLKNHCPLNTRLKSCLNSDLTELTRCDDHFDECIETMKRLVKHD